MRQEILNKVKQYEETSMFFGKYLYEIKESKSYKDWGFKNFESYVKSELGMDLRRAYFHISIWNAFGIILGLQESDIANIGWTKLSKLVPLVKNKKITKENVADWLSKAKTTTYAKLSETVDTMKGNTTSEVPIENFHQAMEPTVDGTFHKISLWLYPEQYESFRRAIEIIAKKANSDKINHLVDLLSLSYLSSDLASSVDSNHQLNWFMRQLENQFKIKLLAYRKESDLVNTLKAITKI